MATLREVIEKASEVREIAERVEELKEQKSALQARLGSINSTLADRTIARDALVNELKALIASLQ